MIHDLLIACNNFKWYLEQENQRGKEFKALIDKINFIFKDLKLNHKILDTSGFVAMHMTKLYKIHEIIVGTYAKLYLSDRERTIFRTPYDSFFQNTLKLKRFPTKIKFLPTQITTEFCQGITYFKTEHDKKAHPFYHRYESCGPNTLTAQSKFSSAQVKNAVKLCYLERAIYDQVFTNLLHYQDIAHLKELRIMQQYYDQYFPYEPLYIKVNFNDNDDSWPIELELITQNRETNKSIYEHYRKPYDFVRNVYKTEVHCKRNVNAKIYEKIQSFESNETSWILV